MPIPKAQKPHLELEVLQLLSHCNCSLQELQQLLSTDLSLLDLAAELVSPMQAMGLVRFRLSGNMCSIGTKGVSYLLADLRAKEQKLRMSMPRTAPERPSDQPQQTLLMAGWPVVTPARTGALDFRKIPSRVGNELIYKH